MEQVQNENDQLVVFIIIEHSLEERSISVATYSSLKRQLQLGIFLDNQHYTALQSFLVQINPNQSTINFTLHAIIPSNQNSPIQYKKINQKISDYNPIFHSPKQIKGQANQSLVFLLKQQIKIYNEIIKQKKACKALEALLFVTQLTKDASNSKQFQLSKINFENFMKLDKAVTNALLLFPKIEKKQLISANTNIFDYLNRCKSPMGGRCLKRWMKYPLQKIDEIQQRLKFVDYFVQNSNVKSTIQNQIKKLPDLDSLYHRFYKSHTNKKVKCQISDLNKLYTTIESLTQLVQTFVKDQHNDIIGKQIVSKIDKQLSKIKNLSDMIEKNVDMSSNRQKQFFIKPQVQKELKLINNQKEDVWKQINKQIQKVEDYLGVDCTRNDSQTYRIVLQVSKKCIQKIKSASDFKFISAKKDKVTFTTQKLTRQIQNLRILEENYKSKQQQILAKMFKVIAGYYPVMEQISKIVSQLDVFTSLATVVSTSQNNWVKPKFNEDQILGKDVFHPLVKNCISNNINLNKKSKTIILTGPNMGGKSTYIRTVGLCVYLAHIGCFVPASEFHTPVIDTIITRVGASDVQVKGISTFMSEMVEAASMLKSSSQKSLILIDQLGRGTSTHQGYGMAWGICEYLHKKINPYCIFATHFHEMTKMADSIEGVRNMHTTCSTNEHELILKYQVVQGKIEKSFGIQVAKMVGFPKRVIDSATSYLKVYENAQNILQGNAQSKGSRLNKNNIREYSSNTKQRIRLMYHEMERRINDENNEQNIESIRQEYKNKMKNVLEKEKIGNNSLKMDIQQ